ncbi:MAG: response regulator [Nitrospirae bacterium]|nr:response regulator [Nitrospirota bacterium]
MSKILIVDDERVFCDLLQSLMKSHGHEVFTAYSGKEALEQFQRNRPHFTMLDLHMPEMNGIETLRQIRAIDQKAAVMILTAWGTDDLEQQARQLGATDFLSKAISLDAIVASMDRGLKPPGQAPATSVPPGEKKPAPPRIPETDAVFLVEGDTDARNTFIRVLGQHGIVVRAAKDGPTLLSMLDKERPPLIVLDMDLSGMKGLDVLRTMREKNYTGGIIIMTAGQSEKLLKEALNLGSIDILGKPVEPERLMLAIQVGLVLIRS